MNERRTVMKKMPVPSGLLFGVFLILSCADPNLSAQEYYGITHMDIKERKAYYDDPRPLFESLPYEKVLPADIYESLIFDSETMKKTWAEAVGFCAPDVVGKRAPEITPGTYSYKDKENYPFKELMLPPLYDRFKPGEPPHIGNFSTITVIPTRQYYWSLPIAQATIKNAGKTRQDDQGYIDHDTYVAGYPFPRPSGEHKAHQLMYNWEKRYTFSDSFFFWNYASGFDENLKLDFESEGTRKSMRLHGRALMKPYGWFDERAEKNKEREVHFMMPYSPRDQFGAAVVQLNYLEPDRFDNWMIYVPVLRRIRKLSQTDTQDPAMGQDLIFDDIDMFNQKMTPDRFPYTYEVIEEREYLTFAHSIDGKGYLSSETFELCDHAFERRPMYVVKLTQQDDSYVYSYRIFYIDKETFIIHYVENYDQKGRLYRTSTARMAFHPEVGLITLFDGPMFDHIDLHSTWNFLYTVPAPGLSRSDVDMSSIIRTIK